MKKKSVGILGSTGSVGVDAVKVLAYHLGEFTVEYLVANENYQLLASQARLLHPKFIVIVNSAFVTELKNLLHDIEISILSGEQGLQYVSNIKCDLVVSAIVGSAGLVPTYNAIKSGSNIALANKESLVCAGDILMEAAKKYQVDILPVDSEHSGIIQVLSNKEAVSKVILTASGGPFYGLTKAELMNVTRSDALKHPTWKMGNKITIDSATMFNKGFELIEASYLFDLKKDKLDVIIHPQSIIHAMVQYSDGSLLAQMSNTTMEIPLHIAMFWPERKNYNAKMLDLVDIAKLEFFAPDRKNFRSLDIIDQVMRAGGNAGIIVNAANEIAVEAFLSEKISFLAIYDIVAEILDIVAVDTINDIEEVLECDARVRSLTKEVIKKAKFL
jgi:1-deoxy-D-xylulose-5-phosphate reductoisomerase